MPEDQNSADNYAVLFVGGARESANYSRYYNSLKGIYEVLTEQYGLAPENVSVLYGDGGNSGPDKNITDDVADHIQGMSRKDGIQYLRDLASSNGVDLTVDEAGQLMLIFADGNLKREQRVNLEILEQKINRSQGGLTLNIKFVEAASKDDGYLVNADVLAKSDMGFANGSRVLPGQGPSLRGALNDLSSRVDDNDHVFFWTFDHGGVDGLENMADIDGKPWSEGRDDNDFHWGRRDVGNKSILNGWGDEIGNADLAQWIAPVIANSGYTTLAYNQCFAGGMLDASRPALTSAKNAYGMSATNAYEVSLDYFFAEGVRLALQGNTDPKANQVFASAKASDTKAAKYTYLDNDGPRKVDIEHPWAFGGSNGDFSVFSVGDGEHPLEKQGIDLLNTSQFAPESTLDQRDLLLKEDGSLDLKAALIEQFGPDVVVDAVVWPTHGSLELLDGALTYVPLTNFHGIDNVLVRYSTPSSTGELRLSLEVQAVNDAPLVSDDFVNMDSDTNRVKFSIDTQPGYFGDVDPDGDNLRISGFSAPENGRIKKDGKDGFLYKPNAGFVGTDKFLYQVTDGELYSVAEVSISVGGGAFSLDPFDGFYQLASDDADPIVNPLRARDGSLLSDTSSGRWDVVAAVSVGSNYKLLLQGEGRREGYYQVWTAGESGQVIDQRKRWLSPDQIDNNAYAKFFGGFASNVVGSSGGLITDSDGGMSTLVA